MRQHMGLAALVLCSGLVSLAPSAPGEEQPRQRVVAATIDGEPVYLHEAQHEFNRAFGKQEFDESQKQALLRRALEQVIDRRLVLAYLERSGQAASGQDVDFSMSQLENDLKSQGLTLAEHLKQVGMPVEDVRRALAWKLSWNKYLERSLTDENLQKYFDKHRCQFDGTQLRVAHILLKLPANDDEVQLAAAREKAAALRTEITAGKLTFGDAARQHSQAPTGNEGGDIGWIERHQPMPEAFSQAAYALEKGQVSEPVLSSAGIHLITILDIKLGQKTRPAVDAELRPAVTLYLFRWIGDKERAKVKVEYVESKP